MLIVIADKDPYDLQALCAGLSAPEREIVLVEDGNNVVTLAQSRTPDVVIAAASIGHMGGFAVSRELKMLAEQGVIAREPKVIVMLERDADAWLAEWSRCDAYTTKPVDPAEIDELVRKIVGEKTPA